MLAMMDVMLQHLQLQTGLIYGVTDATRVTSCTTATWPFVIGQSANCKLCTRAGCLLSGYMNRLTGLASRKFPAAMR
jgi:hypothetical protein